MGRAFEKKSFKSKTGRGGSRPGAGRPRGARNRISGKLKEMLAPLDQIGITRLERIIRQGSDKHAVEAIRLTWAYRFGPPKGQGEYAERGDTLTHPGAVLVIGGTEEEYVQGFRRARGDSRKEGPPPGYVAGVAPKSSAFGTEK